MRHQLSIARPPSTKRGRACFKLTFWLTAPEYIQFMRQVALTRLSCTKHLIKALGLENAAEQEHERTIQAAMLKMSTTPAWFTAKKPTRRTVTQSRRGINQPAARVRKAA